ncbi:MAG: LysR family transcriptional regulator [Deltaproteobacteria bacterium]|nr:LysR family transcriptional regulator [Deltaproteobacteria bacterium]
MLDELQHLILVAELGTLTAAARRAHLSQPALTASIQRLEEDFGAQLLLRGRGGATLTAAGQALLPRAQAALAAVEEGRRAVAEVMGLAAGEVRVGAGATVCTYLLPPILKRFRARHPGIRFFLSEVTTEEAQDALRAGHLDLAIVAHSEAEPWRDDPLILVRGPDFAPPAVVDEAPFVTFRPGASSRAVLEAHFPRAAFVMELGGIAAVKGMVRAGIGLALVSRSAVGEDLARGRLIEVPDPRTPLIRPLGLLHRGLERLPPAAAAFRAELLG